MQRGADVKNLPAVLFEFFERRATNVEGAFQVDINHGSETVWRKLFCLGKKISRRAVNDDVDFAEALDGCGHSLRDFIRPANIGGHGKGLTKRGVIIAALRRVVDGRGRRLEMFQATTDQRDVGAGFRERPRDAAGNARAATGHKRYAACKNSVS